MSKSLDAALNNDAWSVSAIIADLNDMLDDEGRPISERRADAAVRVDVEMEMRKCPFEGIREDKWMNVSALAQISQYYNDALAEMAGFRSQTKKPEASWNDILACIVELLAGPAIYLLQNHSKNGPVPAKLAVGHKLAAGMFGVLLTVHERLALGDKLDITVDSFMDLVDELDALVGATYEACAGSPAMIRKASVALMDGEADSKVEISPFRLKIAHALALQVQLGIYWQLYDRIHLWSLLHGEFRSNLKPFNIFLENKLKQAESDTKSEKPPQPEGNTLPEEIAAEQRKTIADALNNNAAAKLLEEDKQTAEALIKEPGSPIQYNGDVETFAVSVTNYLNTYRLFKSELSKIELELRELLTFPSDTEIKLGGVAFPFPQAMPWYELILGRKLGEDGRLTGKSTKIVK